MEEQYRTKQLNISPYCPTKVSAINDSIGRDGSDMPMYVSVIQTKSKNSHQTNFNDL